MTTPALRAIGWNQFFENQLEGIDQQSALIVRISAHHGSQVVAYGNEGEFRVPVQSADADGRVSVGDWVVLNAADHRALKRLERSSLLTRKASGQRVNEQVLVANVDTVFIVTSCNEDFSLARIERYLAMTLDSGATPVVVLTKADLHENPDALAQQAAELHPGLAVHLLDARDEQQAESLKQWCGEGQSVALLGSSGVGKSTLANALGTDNLATGAIRERDGTGKHTTTSRSLHLLPSGGVLVDNPGVREFQLPECETGVADLFEDVHEIIAQCKFSDCKHATEPGCAIRAALESGKLDQRRYDSFLKLDEEQTRNAETLAQRHARDRKTGKLYKTIIAEKKRRRGGG